MDGVPLEGSDPLQRDDLEIVLTPRLPHGPERHQLRRGPSRHGEGELVRIPLAAAEHPGGSKSGRSYVSDSHACVPRDAGRSEDPYGRIPLSPADGRARSRQTRGGELLLLPRAAVPPVGSGPELPAGRGLERRGRARFDSCVVCGAMAEAGRGPRGGDAAPATGRDGPTGVAPARP